MEPTVLQVRMLGRFSLTYGEQQLDDSQNRSKKVWALLAFLLCNHGRTVSQKELLDLLWNEDKDTGNPVSALKTTLHRVRTLLDRLTPDGGHRMILNQNGGYCWNPEEPLWMDIEELEQLCRPIPRENEEKAIARFRRALELYQGDFLSKMSSETWVVPQGTYYHNLYLQTVEKALDLLEGKGLWEEAAVVCGAALKIEPYQESIYQHLMRDLLAMGRRSQAAGVYEEMSKLLLATFGVMPEPESRRLYREALRSTNRKTVPAGVIQEQLRESAPVTGALICDYDFFKMIYQAEARRVARSGDAVHIALLSLRGLGGKALPRRSLDLAMDNLEEQLHTGLRKGDVICRCSPSQFLILLPQANFEDSGKVCQRLLRGFSRKYPHSPAIIEYAVYPLEPTTDDRRPDMEP